MQYKPQSLPRSGIGVARFNTGGTTTGTYVDPLAGAKTGTESSLSSWAGPYVTDMLAKGKALAETPYEAYTGPLTAGTSNLQNKAFSGLAGLTLPTSTETSYTPGSFTGAGYTPLSAAELAAGKTPTYNQASDEVLKKYMSPYLMGALQPQIDELNRQAEIDRVKNASRMTSAGSYGGGRQAIMESELLRNKYDKLNAITGKGYHDAFTAAQNQFNEEEDRRRLAAERAQTYGLDILKNQQTAGATQRDIESEGILADYGQFKDERDYPFKMVQYMQSLLQGQPLETESYSYQEPTGLSQLFGGAGGILDLFGKLGLLGGNTADKQTGNTGGAKVG